MSIKRRNFSLKLGGQKMFFIKKSKLNIILREFFSNSEECAGRENTWLHFQPLFLPVTFGRNWSKLGRNILEFFPFAEFQNRKLKIILIFFFEIFSWFSLRHQSMRTIRAFSLKKVNMKTWSGLTKNRNFKYFLSEF